jgi:hypothetical protein
MNLESVMATQHDQFESRLSLMVKKHRALANGYTARIREDGLIVVEPKAPRRHILPARSVVYAFLGFVGFKTLMLVMMGEATYSDRVALLADGTAVERVGSWLMQIDPVTRFAMKLILSVIG